MSVCRISAHCQACRIRAAPALLPSGSLCHSSPVWLSSDTGLDPPSIAPSTLSQVFCAFYSFCSNVSSPNLLRGSLRSQFKCVFHRGDSGHPPWSRNPSPPMACYPWRCYPTVFSSNVYQRVSLSQLYMLIIYFLLEERKCECVLHREQVLRAHVHNHAMYAHMCSVGWSSWEVYLMDFKTSCTIIYWF